MIAKLKYVFISLLLSSSLLALSQEGTSDSKKEGTVLENLKKEKEYSTFVKALEKTGLDKALLGSNNVTVFAPNNRAFEQDKKVFDELFKDQNLAMLTKIIAAHITIQPFGEKEKVILHSDNPEDPDKLKITTLMGDIFVIQPNQSVYMLTSPTIGEVFIIKSDYSSTNGTFHLISQCIFDRNR